MENKSIISRIIEDDSMKVVFQPIVSLRRKKIIGLEADFIGNVDNKEYTYKKLKEIAEKQKNFWHLERFARRKAMEHFAQFTKNNVEFGTLVLFLAIETSIVEKGVVGSGHIIGLANEFKIQHNHISLKITESKITDMESLRAFTKMHRDNGFIITVDDVGEVRQILID